MHPIGLLEAVHLRDVRVTQRGQDFGFALETRETTGIGGERRGKHFDRDVAIEPGIASPIDLAHAAGANQRGDPK